jgi:hypothetical protein
LDGYTTFTALHDKFLRPTPAGGGRFTMYLMSPQGHATPKSYGFVPMALLAINPSPPFMNVAKASA